ncbi:Peptidoglycan-binding domain 1 protein [[Leptolyngbya] sp. PCC 7376]|uniref:peptidoglycan-binding domain-containing protein n=1 Tax=[Leptolyngbya] sp. PCC 7376 TaxID=111781 RepID=UPI00029F362E|nr:peptidoglycan-binding domain-containing protein [[Leptolyngbya] sp. PCC 7376]AFY36599.1 Peptidoglycan-binding domain 1 protein [[Leptolyngbya] sp. PCC 7376]
MTAFSETFVKLPERSIKLRASGELELGDFGFSVQKLQEHLIRLGFYDGPIDGYLSPETAVSLRQAQAYLRLQVTGCCDAMTWQTLRQIGLKRA